MSQQGLPKTNLQQQEIQHPTIKSKNSLTQIQPKLEEIEKIIIQFWGKKLCENQEEENQLFKDQVLTISEGYGKIIDIIPGDNHLYIKTQKGYFFAFGDNSLNQLGLSDIQEVNNPIHFALPEKVIIKEIFCGSNTSWAYCENSQLFAWGINFFGQLGIGTNKNTTQPTLVSQNQQKDNLFFLEPDEKILQIENKGLHTLLLTSKNKFYSCGNGKHYALGHENKHSSLNFKKIIFFENLIIKKIDTGINHSGCLVENTIYLWGNLSNKTHPLKLPTLFPLEEVQDFVLGNMLTVVLNLKGQVFTLGENNYGQQGVSNPSKNQFNPISLKFKVKQISCGFNHIIVKGEEEIKAWGSNQFQQIQPTLEHKIIPTPVNINWLGKNVHIKTKCRAYQTYLLTENQLNFAEILSPEEKKIEQLQLEFSNLKQRYLQDKRKNETLKSKLKTLKGAVSCFSYKEETISTDDPYEKMMNMFKKELLMNRTVKLNYEIDFKELENLTKIATGTYSVIYRASWRETLVAVKMIKKEIQNDQLILDFLNECRTMQSLRHPNICLFFGACTSEVEHLAIVLEYCPNKTLYSFLNNQQYIIKWNQRIKFAIDIAKAMHYLHSFPIPVIHRDLNSLNILLDENLIPKLTDFGFTRILNQKMTGQVGTLQWMAPELIQNQNSYSEKADVYSFGIILWEIASRQKPFEGQNPNQIALEVVNQKKRPIIPEKIPMVYQKLMQKCWETNSIERPDFLNILKELRSMRLQITQFDVNNQFVKN